MKLTKKALVNMAKNYDKNSLEYDVISYLLDNYSNYDNKLSLFTDVLYHGCVSGIVSHLIYYVDTVKYYEDHQQQINELLYNSLQECGFDSPVSLFGDKWDNEDPLCIDTYNKNLLAWFGFEETMRKIGFEFEDVAEVI